MTKTSTANRLERLARLPILALGSLALALPVSAKEIKYYHLDAVGNVRVVTDQSGAVVERHDYLPFGEECTTGGCASNPGLNAGEPRKFTGKERDRETGLDYFGARYYGARIGRFTTVDPVYTWQENLVDPQRWNRYAYARNNPLRYVDPDGRAIETPWDAFNVGLGVASLSANVRDGNWGGALLDAAGIAYDAAATAVPALPGGAGTLIKGIRAADKAADLVRAGDKAADAARAADRINDATRTAVKPGSTSGPGAGKRATPRERQEALSENSGRCVFCDKPAAEADHSIPRSRGGDTTTGSGGNLQPTCQHCNRQKGAKTSQEYIEWKQKQN